MRTWIKKWIKNIRIRKAEVAMLHISLNSSFWHPMDAVFVLTGWVIK